MLMKREEEAKWDGGVVRCRSTECRTERVNDGRRRRGRNGKGG
jgi:hypothetical protein